jgi:hypothetical protein
MSALDWIAENLGVVVLTLPWTWPIMETLHFIGLCMLLGGLLVIDLRLLGYNRLIPTVASHDILPIVYTGLAINTLTGVLFFIGDPHRYFVNISFQIKMLLVVLAGLNALWYQFKLSPRIDALPAGGALPGEARVAGALSLGLWFGVLILGRLIPYLGTG